ncbi:MAG: chromosome segregation SMC family protein [Candidatus Aenigmatarchaeota archaeon]
MTRLNRIIMQGFKSFPTKTSIPFPVNFSAVAGPNGSGKSNVIDALTFVLGVSSARLIRAQKLENILFNGGQDKKPSDYAYVAIYLDNKDRRIPIDSEEIKISRKVSKKGTSMFKVNGKTETKTKVVELLSYVGLSAEGHNIILQGDVTHIIEMSPLERRIIIDEISGIAEFDDKKEKARRELERVDTRARELMIMVTEKEKLIERLKQEKETAEHYEKLAKSLNRHRASLAKIKLTACEEKLGSLDKEISEKVNVFHSFEEKTQKSESGLEKEEKSLKLLSDKILSKSRNIELAKKLDETRMELVRKKDKLESNNNDIARMQGMLGELQSMGAGGESLAVKSILNASKSNELSGIRGTVMGLISVPQKYSTAIEVCLARHSTDIVVNSDMDAVKCIKYLKKNKIGRARFIPLNKISGRLVKKDSRAIDVAINLVKFDEEFRPAMIFLLGSTQIVEKIDDARDVSGRVVTLDGDLKEKSGIMLGGFYRQRRVATGVNYDKEIADLEEHNTALEKEIAELEKKLSRLQSEEREESEEVKQMQEELKEREKAFEEMKKTSKEGYDERYKLQSEINEKKISRAKVEADYDNVKLEFDEIIKLTGQVSIINKPKEELETIIKTTVTEMNRLGPVNMKAIKDYDTMNAEFGEMRGKLSRLLEEKAAVENAVAEVEKNRHDKFIETLDDISKNFGRIYLDLMAGSARLRLEEEGNIESGLMLEANPPGKRILNLDAMSGGEKSMTALAFLFAVMQHYSAPFYVLDEIDAALDKANTRKVDLLIQKYSGEVQFIVITHNDATIAAADNVIGVSMEAGVSKIVGIDLKHGIKPPEPGGETSE